MTIARNAKGLALAGIFRQKCLKMPVDIGVLQLVKRSQRQEGNRWQLS